MKSWATPCSATQDRDGGEFWQNVFTGEGNGKPPTFLPWEPPEHYEKESWRSEIETKKTVAKINETKRWFFVTINTVDKFSTTHQEKKKERTQINTIRKEKGEVTMDTIEIQKIIRDYYMQWYVNKMVTWKKCINT